MNSNKLQYIQILKVIEVVFNIFVRERRNSLLAWRIQSDFENNFRDIIIRENFNY